MPYIKATEWKGGTDPTSFPHLCPYRPEGADKDACIELSGSNYQYNRSGCCGTTRGPISFKPCNSIARKCVVCLENGRRGTSANVVVNVEAGTCEEHDRSTVHPVSANKAHTERVPRQRLLFIPPDWQKEAGSAQPASRPADRVQPATKKRRTKAAEKLAALERASLELKKYKDQLTVTELVGTAAKDLHMTAAGLRSFYCRSVPQDAKNSWLYGEGGREISRREQKFNILMCVREELRKKGGPKPRKKELAEAAAKPLGMKLISARTYIYERLSKEEAAALDLRKQYFTRAEQFMILKQVRKNMQDRGLPPPRQTDLAEAAAPWLKQKASSVRSLIVSFNKEEKDELACMKNRSSGLVGLDPTVVKEGFAGAIAVLKVRRAPITINNIRLVLRLKQEVVELYLTEHPELRTLLDSSV